MSGATGQPRFAESQGQTKLYGRTIPRLELDRGGRLFDLARMLGMSDFLNDILAQWRPQRAKTQSEAEREAGEEFAIDLIILRHEADALGIRPTTSEIASVVSKMRAFRGDAGGFDPKSITTSWGKRIGTARVWRGTD